MEPNLRKFFFALQVSLLVPVVLCPQSPPGAKLDALIHDTSGQPLAGVRVELTDSERTVRVGETDELGRIAFPHLAPGRYRLSAARTGFAAFVQAALDLTAAGLSLEVTMVPSLTHSESVEVHGTVMAVEESASSPNKLPPQKAKELPSRPTTVADALPLTPGVIREPGGGLVLSSSPENRSALIVNSADVTDPATGNFGLTVPIDSVEVLNVYQTAYLAEYGRFTAGLVSVETRRGGDKWKWELNDPLPEFRIRSYHLRGLKTATPRLNFEGPIVSNKLFVSEGFEYAVRKTAVYTQPFPLNQKKQAGINTFTQLDWVASSSHLLTATLHIAPQRSDALNLDAFNPREASPDSRAHNYTGTVLERLSLHGGLLENRFSITRFEANVWGLGQGDLVIAPAGNTGNYFADQNRSASRVSGSSRYSFAPFTFRGSHNFKIGGYLAGSEHAGDIDEHPIEVVDNSARRLLRIAFQAPRSYEVSDLEKAFFAQDHWILTERLAADAGVRTEAQQISGAFRVAPRAGVSWTPFRNTGPIIRGGFGYFYDRVPLNVYGFNRYPGRIVTLYDPVTAAITNRYLFVNTLGQSRVRFPFVSQKPVDGNFSPRSHVWSVQAEQPVTRRLNLRATFLRNDGDALVTLTRTAPDPVTDVGAFLLEGTGESHYRQFDVTAQVRWRDDRQLFLSWVRSQARGNINDFGRFLGTVPTAIIREDQEGTLPTDLPSRFLAWGVVRLPHKFQLAPVIEYRSGFPYLEVDAAQRYAGVPYRHRFPRFLSIDARFSKDIQVHPKYSVRLSISAFNLTNHFNPEAVRANTGDPAYGYFFGHRGRRFTADFDFLF